MELQLGMSRKGRNSNKPNEEKLELRLDEVKPVVEQIIIRNKLLKAYLLSQIFDMNSPLKLLNNVRRS